MSKIKKLIEVALPLDAINEASAREKSIRHGHPSTLHLWWARRPLATARAVIFASLVDAPSSHPELFPTKEEQDRERKRLFGIIERLVKWENINDKELFDEAYTEIKKYCGDKVPTLLDPFAGGGAIPLEAQRLGLKAVASDINPVSVIINKAMIEIPPQFIRMPPVNPKDSTTMIGGDMDWHGVQGLAADVRYYGELLKNKVFEKIGHLYPKIKNPKTGENLTVIAWIWARTVKCPNPACGCDMPLIKSFWLSKKAGKEVYLEPISENRKVRFEIKHGKGRVHEGTVARTGVKCICCGESAPLSYVRNEGKDGHIGTQLVAIVADSINGRVYFPANNEHMMAANISKPDSFIDGEISKNPRWFSPPAFGLNNFSDLFTNRQLTALITFSDFINDIKKQIIDDGGTKEYSNAVSVYLVLGISRMADIDNALCSWETSKTQVRHLFTRQAIPMLWDFGENNIFNDAAGDYMTSLSSIIRVLEKLNPSIEGTVKQIAAQTDCGLRHVMISTDPPYYDNIGYADLSDFFYIWLRRNLKDIYPDVFSTMLVPKKDELIAIPYRFDGNKEQAKDFFETGMAEVCKQLYNYSRNDIPLTVYYAYKQSDTDKNGTASSGWETMLNAIIKAGFSITGTWPMRTEMSNRQVAMGTNALASSIVLVCRKRELNGQVCSRKDFLRQLRLELTESIDKLQSASIAPVDMMQSAIGPGISVFSRYDQVLEADGSEMSVRTALQIINQELDAFFGGQSEGLDAESRFAVELFAQAGFDELDFGTADVLARAKNTSVARVADTGAIISGRGRVRITKREEMEHDKADDKTTWMTLQHLAFAMEREGIRGCAKVLLNTLGDNDSLKNLAYHMYQLSEEKHLSQEAGVYNNLVISWNEILSATEELRSQQPEQMNLLEV